MPLSDPWLPATPTPLMAAIPVRVYRVHTTGTPPAVASLESLPNVECLAVEEREGPNPSTALFAYVFGQDDDTAPQTLEDCLSTTSSLARVVQVGDRLAVSATRPDGAVEWLFDGLPYEWGLEIDGDSGAEVVTMTAYGLAKECRNAAIGGALVRHSDKPTTPTSGTTSNDVQTDEVAQFNPRGKPNATPAGGNSGTAPADYPVFLDPALDTDDEDANLAPWTLPMAARYLLFTGNAGANASPVTNPTGAALDALLVARQPITGTAYDPTNSATYTAAAIRAPDTPLTGRDWPAVLHDLVKHYGFGMSWPLTSDGAGYPTTAVNLFLKQAGTARSVWLPPRGSDFDPTTCNVGAARMSRDLAGVVNQWKVVGALKRYEVSVVLAPGFASVAGDASNPATFKESDPAFYTTVGRNDQYRLWVFDECGEGHYANASTTNVATIPTLDGIFGAGIYVRRRRRPIGELFRRDGNGKPLRAQLRISTDYAAAYPAAWDGSGTWRLADGGWELLHDRLGVRLTCDDPNKWNVGKAAAAGTLAKFNAGVVKAVQCLAAPDTSNPAFFLMLTCVVEGDQAVNYLAARSAATSPLSQVIVREIDARDRYAYQAQAKYSFFNQTAAAVVVRDDSAPTDDNPMQAEGLASRIASEAGVFDADPIEVPYLTRYYQVGDRIDQVAGRNLGLRTDTGGTGYLPVLPIVVGRRWELKDGQRTFLTLSDEGTHRKRIASAAAVRAQAKAARTFEQQSARAAATSEARKRFRDTYGVGKVDGDFS